MAKLVSLLVKFGALYFVLGLNADFAIVLQLLGGVWIIQTLPAVLIGLYTRWLNSWALLLGWASGIAIGTGMVVQAGFKATPYAISLFGLSVPAYPAVWALIANIVVSLALSAVFRGLGGPERRDATIASDYV